MTVDETRTAVAAQYIDNRKYIFISFSCLRTVLPWEVSELRTWHHAGAAVCASCTMCRMGIEILQSVWHTSYSSTNETNAGTHRIGFDFSISRIQPNQHNYSWSTPTILEWFRISHVHNSTLGFGEITTRCTYYMLFPILIICMQSFLCRSTNESSLEASKMGTAIASN